MLLTRLSRKLPSHKTMRPLKVKAYFSIKMHVNLIQIVISESELKIGPRADEDTNSLDFQKIDFEIRMRNLEIQNRSCNAIKENKIYFPWKEFHATSPETANYKLT